MQGRTLSQYWWCRHTWQVRPKAKYSYDRHLQAHSYPTGIKLSMYVLSTYLICGISGCKFEYIQSAYGSAYTCRTLTFSYNIYTIIGKWSHQGESTDCTQDNANHSCTWKCNTYGLWQYNVIVSCPFPFHLYRKVKSFKRMIHFVCLAAFWCRTEEKPLHRKQMIVQSAHTIRRAV